MSLPTEIVNDFYLEVARGNVTGYTAKELIGFNADIDAGTEDVWNQGGSRTLATTAGVVAVSSTSTLDINQYISVTGLNEDYDEITEIIGPLTGRTRVTGTTTFWRVNNVAVSAITGVAAAATTAALLYVSSSSAADVGQTVTVTGTNASGAVITEAFTLNGQSKVTGTKLFMTVTDVSISAANAGQVYVYFASAITAGVPTTESAIQIMVSMPLAGKVYAAFDGATTAGVPDDLTKVQGVIEIAGTRAYNALYTVPRNKNWYLTSLRYASTGASTAFNVVIEVRRTVYGETETVVKTVKYSDLGTTNYTRGQIQYTDHPVLFPAKAEIRVRVTLGAGGSNLNLANLTMNFIEEDIVAVPKTVSVISVADYAAKIALAGTTNVSQNFWLIGLDSLPSNLPATVNLDDVLCTITGHAHAAGVLQPYVAADTEVAFDRAYFTSGKLVSTTKRAVVTIMRCVDSAGNVDYVFAPVNTLIDLGNVKKTIYLTA